MALSTQPIFELSEGGVGAKERMEIVGTQKEGREQESMQPHLFLFLSWPYCAFRRSAWFVLLREGWECKEGW